MTGGNGTEAGEGEVEWRRERKEGEREGEGWGERGGRKREKLITQHLTLVHNISMRLDVDMYMSGKNHALFVCQSCSLKLQGCLLSSPQPFGRPLLQEP